MTVAQVKVQRALWMANEAHQNEWRKHSGLPYMVHIYDLMKMASQVGISTEDWETYCTIILHDSYENGRKSLEAIHYNISPEVGDYVDALSFLPEEHKGEDIKVAKQNYLDGLAKPGVPIPVLVTKVLDRLCNTLDFFKAGQVSYAKRYLGMADLLFDSMVWRFDEIYAWYGTEEVPDRLRCEYYRVRQLVNKENS